MKDLKHAMAVTNANWNSMNLLLGDEPSHISGSYYLSSAHWQEPSGSYCVADGLYSQPVRHEDILVNSIKVLTCGHCGQKNRIDESKLGAIAVLDCQACGASLI